MFYLFDVQNVHKQKNIFPNVFCLKNIINVLTLHHDTVNLSILQVNMKERKKNY